jgi:Subtilisin inhibitor-like
MVLKTVEHHAQEIPPITKQTTLTCEPPGGRHPRPPLACDELIKADGDIGRIPARAGACPNIFAPVEATAVGEWRGHPFKFAVTYPNRCNANRDSSDFFDF